LFKTNPAAAAGLVFKIAGKTPSMKLRIKTRNCMGGRGSETLKRALKPAFTVTEAAFKMPEQKRTI